MNATLTSFVIEQTVTRVTLRESSMKSPEYGAFVTDSDRILIEKGNTCKGVTVVTGRLWSDNGQKWHCEPGTQIDVVNLTSSDVADLIDSGYACETRVANVTLVLAAGETRTIHEPATARQITYLSELLNSEPIGLRISKRAASQMIEEVLAGSRNSFNVD